MKFSIDKPATELENGIFTLFLKYVTLFIVAWFACWIILLILIRDDGSGQNKLLNFMLDNPGYISAGIAMLVPALFIYKTINKSRRGTIVSIEFDEQAEKVVLGLFNTFNGRYREVIVEEKALSVKSAEGEDELLGKRRLFAFFENNKAFTEINIDATAWVRHPDLDLLIKKLKSFGEQKPGMAKN